MRFRDVSTSVLAALALTSAPVAVQAAPLEAGRTSAAVDGEQLGSGMGAAWIVALALVVALGIVVLTDDDESPTSP